MMKCYHRLRRDKRTVSVNYVKRYKDIPSNIINTFHIANPFFLESVSQYYSSIGKQILYFFDDERIMPLVVSKKYCFRYGYLPTEPWIYSVQNANKSETLFLDNVIEKSKKIGLKLDWIGQTPPSALLCLLLPILYPSHSETML